METVVTTLASANKGFFEALGIDWQLLVIQTIAFLVLLWILSKYVYPPLTAMLEKRDADIEAGVQAAQQAEKKAEAAKDEVAQLLKDARREASDIVSTAKQEATATAEAVSDKAKTRAERIVADAHEQIEKDVVAAKKALQHETLDLVALATEKVVGKTVTAKVDEGLVARVVKEAQEA